jgi:hypothetical protein
MVQALRSRMWFLVPTAVLCGIEEILGCVKSYYDPLKHVAEIESDYYKMVCASVV